RLEQQAQRLTSTRKECHRRRLLLLAQQRLMNSGPQSYHRCPHCTKAFINASFLNAHLFRRHAEVVSALQDIDLNQITLPPLDSGTNLTAEKGITEKPHVLTPNLEQQIQEVLDHLKSQIPPPLPQPPPLTSAVVQTIEVKDAASPRLSAAVEIAWRQRTAELERQLEEERDHLRQLEERNRAWQDSIASQHRSDVERVREMFEMELRNLREENLETQRQLIQLRIKRANVSSFEGVEADVQEQLERQVRSLEEVKSPVVKMVTVSPKKHSPEKVPLLPASPNPPLTKIAINTSNATHAMGSSWPMVSRGVGCSDGISSLSQAIPSVPGKHSRRQQTSGRESLGLANASIQVTLNEVTSQLATCTLANPQKQQTLLTNKGVIVESLIVRTEDEEDGESDRTRSIHLIPFAVSSPSFLRTALTEASPKREKSRSHNEAELGNNKVVQLVDGSINKSEYTKERSSKSRSFTHPKKVDVESLHKFQQANGSELRMDPLESGLHYKDQLEEFRSDPDAMKGLRKEVEVLLMEQLIDHDVNGDASGLTRGKFNETLDILGQERQQLMRKHPNFAEIRASIARKVDRMALIALHSKRERRDSSFRGGGNGIGGGDGDTDGGGLQKKPRASRIADRDTLSRPPSGRPASLTLITHTLSPITEHQRFATSSPALKKSNPTQSRQSLFENTEDEGDDDGDDGRLGKAEGRTVVYRILKKSNQGMEEEADNRPQAKDDDDEDDGPMSVCSMVPEVQGDSGLSLVRPKTRRGERADSVADSVSTLSSLRLGASYTISTGHWDTRSQVDNNQRSERAGPPIVSPQARYKSIKEVLDGVEQALSDYYSYEKERMQELIEMELSLWQECTIFAEKIELWGKYSSSQMHHSIGRIRSQGLGLTKDKNILPDVFAFQNFLDKNGGRTGGWHDFDHRTFLKIRRRYTYKHSSNDSDSFVRCTLPDDLKDTFAQEVASALCLTSQSEVFAHEAWFAKLQQLEAASNRALREHRPRKAGALSATLSCKSDSVIKTRHQSAPLPNRQRQRALMDSCTTKCCDVVRRLEVEQKARERQRLSEKRKSQKGIQELRTKLEVFNLKMETVDAIQTRKCSIHRNVERVMRQCLTEMVNEKIQENPLDTAKSGGEWKKPRAQEKLGIRISQCKPAKVPGYTELWELRVQALKSKAKSPQPKLSVVRMIPERQQLAVPEWRRRAVPN
ncbi:hypothetical protein TcWFU_000462, partial [Taenia crassiceps]